MRILHTSDWHLGRSIGDFGLLDDQRTFLRWLAGVVAERSVDLVAVAGDVFDRSVPPAAAVALLRDALVELRQAGAEVVLIAGNHDGADRLAAYDGLTEASGLILRGGYSRASQMTVREYQGVPLAILAIPFLDPALAPPGYGQDTPNPNDERVRLTHHDVLARCVAEARSTVPNGVATLVLAHAFVRGGEVSDSERQLSIGAAAEVDASLFDGFDYVALGHLHRPQIVGGQQHIRYCGTPLPYSFSETGAKQVLLVDIGADRDVLVESVPVPVGRRVVTVRGPFDELVEGVEQAVEDEPFVRVELTDTRPVLDAHRLLRGVYPFLVEIDRIGQSAGSSDSRPVASTLRRLDPLDQAEAFWDDVTDHVLGPAEQALLAEVLAEVGAGGGET